MEESIPTPLIPRRRERQEEHEVGLTGYGRFLTPEMAAVIHKDRSRIAPSAVRVMSVRIENHTRKPNR